MAEKQHSERLKTQYLRCGSPAAVVEAAAWLRRGHPVVFPTDTVYGAGVLPFEDVAIQRLYAIKGRPAEKGIPILLADMEDLDKVARNVPPAADALMRRFWPGPLTLIVPRVGGLPDSISSDDTIAVRIPDHAIARTLIRAVGGAVATTSANLSGMEPARTGVVAMNALAGLVAAVLDDGPSPGEQPSTIVDFTRPSPIILRSGPLSAADLGLEVLPLTD